MNSLNYTLAEINQFVFKLLLRGFKALIDFVLMVLFLSNIVALIGLVLYLEIAAIFFIMEYFSFIDNASKILNNQVTLLSLFGISSILVMYSIFHIKNSQQSLLGWINSHRINQFLTSAKQHKKQDEIIKDDKYWANYYFQRAEKFRYGNDVEENIEYAIKLYQAAAKLEHNQAQVSLSYLLLMNKSTDKKHAKNSFETQSEAFSWAQKAAEKNEPGAWFNLGYMYKNGLGTSVNLAKALYAFEQAIYHGFYNIEQSGAAFYEIGILYLDDQQMDKNYSKAIKWLTKADGADYPNAETALKKAQQKKKQHQEKQQKYESKHWYDSKQKSKPNHQDENQQVTSRLINCPTCEKSLVIPEPIPKGNGICTKCHHKFRIKVDSHGNIQIYSIIPKSKDTSQFPKTEKEAREVLSILTRDGSTLIRQAYKIKIRDYHPDKVNNLGAKLKTLAEVESKRINAAYELLKNPA